MNLHTGNICVDNTQTPETFNCRHGKLKCFCLRQVGALHLQSLTFKSLWLENCLALYQERRLTCVYLLTVVDQKNPISRHRREEKAYKNTSFTSLIRSYEVTLPGVKLNLSYIHKKISNSDGSTVVILCGEKKEEEKEKDRKNQPAACVISPTVLYMHHFSSFSQIHKELLFFFPLFLNVTCPSVLSSNRGGRCVMQSGSVVTQRHHEGRFSGSTSTAQRLANMSHIWSKGEHLSKRCVNLLW